MAENRIVREDLRKLVSESKKYSRVSPDTLDWVVDWALSRSRSPKEAAKRAKTKLHQVTGGFIAPEIVHQLHEEMTSLAQAHSREQLLQWAEQAMEKHISTQERVVFLPSFCREIFSITGMPSSVLDLGCGLHPMAIPQMGLALECFYTAVDIDRGVCDLIARWFNLLGQSGEVLCQNIVLTPVGCGAELVFLLKLLPTLEQQVRGFGHQLLTTLEYKHAVVSFPTSSLGGHGGKGMRSTYSLGFETFLQQQGWQARRFDFPSELVYVVAKTQQPEGKSL